MKHKRFASYLFLQGPASPFFTRLAAALKERGHQVWRINFNGGDRVFWHHPGALDYAGNEKNFSAFLTRQFIQWSITDIVLLGDCRPLHKLAIEAARFFGVKTHIFEEGYIRPNWITLEHSGVNGFSSLPHDINSFLSAASHLDAEMPPLELPSKLPRRALDDVIYAVSTMLLAWRYPNYKRHWPYGQIAEYWYGGHRLLSRTINNRRRERAIAEIINSGQKYYVFPMQVDVDSQIIFHSHFNGQADVIKSVIKSFSLNAPGHSTLVITEHPLETSPNNWRRIVTEQAAAFGVTARVRFFAAGSPKELLATSRGIVVVNSTTGHQGLELGVPVIALSPAVFNLPGVTFQGGLDRFWTESHPANLQWIKAFRSVIIDRTQLNGGFFSKRGIAAAVANAIPRMEAASGVVLPATKKIRAGCA